MNICDDNYFRTLILCCPMNHKLQNTLNILWQIQLSRKSQNSNSINKCMTYRKIKQEGNHHYFPSNRKEQNPNTPYAVFHFYVSSMDMKQTEH